MSEISGPQPRQPRSALMRSTLREATEPHALL